jgi:hypothetical protein
MMSDPSNHDRASWAQSAIQTFAHETGMDNAGEDLPTIIGDLLADLMHLCVQKELDFKGLLETAEMHFTAESVEVSTSTYP